MNRYINKVTRIVLIGLGLIQLATISQVSASQKEEVIVATDAATKPFTYKEGERHTGYDIEVLKQIFKGSKNLSSHH